MKRLVADIIDKPAAPFIQLGFALLASLSGQCALCVRLYR